MENTQNPDELAELIDKLMSEGSGHVNISAKDGADHLKVDTVNSTACSGGACMIPNMNAIDEDIKK